MIKYIIILMLSIMPLCAESIEETKKRFIDEREKCNKKRNFGINVMCHLKITNELLMLILIKQMKD